MTESEIHPGNHHRFHNCRPRLSARLALAVSILIAAAFALTARVTGQDKSATRDAAVIALGSRLFRDQRFSSPDGDLANSCAGCHLQDQDPQGHRAFTDFFNRSWVPWRREDPRREENRNTPTIFDSDAMPRLHFDGEFPSLEELVKGTLAGRPMGWLPSETIRSLTYVYDVVLKDRGESTDHRGPAYRDQFKQAFGADVEQVGRDQTIDLTARAISAYIRTLRSARRTSYDQFVRSNGLDPSPTAGEDARAFARRTLESISSLEARRALKLGGAFDAQALNGFKIFLTTAGESSTGNCVVCHSPPAFTDNAFHNMGVSQSDYEAIHGAGSFWSLSVPGVMSKRPVAELREMPSKRDAALVDLGYWNFVDLKSSPQRRPGESDEAFLRRMIATFKTPTLRNLAYSQPYLHNGAFNTIEDTLGELMRLSSVAREGSVREADEDLLRIKITREDIAPLAAFLRSLSDPVKK
ncbi:MAG TPA: cytochrome c peroxidase [Blastocatellia bacterium]|nr:cytochrome c peroxidase [Blastocatellia bacterium]